MEATAICSDEGVTPVTSNNCQLCGGVGYYKESVPYGHPRFGVLIPCRCKLVEREHRKAHELLEMSNLSAFQEKTSCVKGFTFSFSTTLSIDKPNFDNFYKKIQDLIYRGY